MLEPGGTIVYTSCSLQPEEGHLVIERALAGGLPLERVPVEPAELRGLPADLSTDGAVRTLPSALPERGGLDGFFIARLRRRA
jgi:16S rRNA (cytosine967-C5)-methyltransferase